MVAVCGLLAAFIVIRARARNKRNLYASLRADRERRIKEARERALAPMRTGPGGAIMAPATAGAASSQPTFTAGAPVAPPPVPTPAPAPPPEAVRPKTPPPLPELPTAHTPYSKRLDTPRPVGPVGPEEEEEARERPSFAMSLLSYAGLAAALIVVALGVVLMIEASSR